ncbi:MAG: alanine racemase [Actinobacteria bacterium]|nr:alanine racemase [Actinomycetota bacterium]
MKTSPRSSVLIDLAAIRHNVGHLVGMLSPGSRMLVAVKADGYGHGTLPVARAAVAAGATGVAVATAEEAVALRDAGFSGAILVMGPLYSFDQYEEIARQDVDFAVVSDHMARVLPQLRGSGLKARVHLKIDSGMNRQGIFPSDVGWFLDSIRDIPEIELAGVMTHFACASDDPATIRFQLDRFLPAVEEVRQEWPRAIAHAANSAATVHDSLAHLDMVRCGCAVYGLSPWQADPIAEGLRPALTWRSQVALVKRVAAGEGVGYGHTFRPSSPTDVALVPIGYGDGVFRALSNCGEVLIKGRRYAVAGRISMDSFGVDVGTDGHVQVDDPVTLIGADGNDRITAEEVAQRLGTINYEITCDIALDRTERHFLNGDD